jgi:PAS domain S-box-containing protein
MEAAQSIVWRVDTRTLQVTFISRDVEALLGFPPERWLEPGFWPSRIHPEDRPRTVEHMTRAAAGDPVQDFEYRVMAAEGRVVWLRTVARVTGVPGELLGVTFDQTARRRADALLAGDLKILQMMAAGLPMPEVLQSLVRVVEEQAEGMIGSILLLEDGVRVRHAAGDRLPAEYIKAIDGQEIGPDAGSCGTAAYRRETVIVEDIATDPLWARYKTFALNLGLRACWSVPIMAHDRSVLGTFALYYSQPRRPTPELLELARHASHLAAVAIERHQRLQAIVENEAFTRAIVDHALDANILMDSGGIITGWSKRAAEIFGWSSGEAVGRKLSELIIPERDRARHDRGLEHFRDTGEGPILNRRLEVSALHRRGHEFPVELAVSPIRREGRMIFSAFIADITERKRAVEALRVSEEHLSLVYRHVDDVLFHLQVEPGGDYRFISVNPAFCRSTGVEANQVVGKLVREVIPEPSLSLVLRNYERAIRTNRTVRWEEVTRYPTGDRYGDVVITPVFDSEGRPKFLVGSVHDFTESRKMEEENRQLQKLDAIGRLTGGVAHDFNNLLTVILGYGELLLAQDVKEAYPRADLQEIVNAGRRAAELTRQLLAFARRQTLQPHRIDFNMLVRGLEKMLRRLIRENIGFEMALAPDLWPVLADPGQIEQVIVNLAVNARDAIADAGRVTFETSNVELDADYARSHPGVVPGSHVMLAISDTGCGMDEETRKRIFEPFFTTKEKGKGTGLGLATVYGIVKQSGGHIWLYSEPGQGTSFKVFLPRADAGSEETKVRTHAPAPQAGGEKILVVEDEGALRVLCERMLKGLKYNVTVARHGEEAAAAVEQQGLKPDLLLTDMIMPGMSGKELADRLRLDNPRLKVLFMSGYTDKTIGDQFVLGPGMTFLQKPFTVAALATALRKSLEIV